MSKFAWAHLIIVIGDGLDDGDLADDIHHVIAFMNVALRAALLQLVEAAV